MLSALSNGGKVFKPKIALLGLEKDQLITYQDEVQRHISMPKPVRDLLFTGMRKVLSHEKAQPLKSFLPRI
ncbi:hypothetical protein N9Y92_01555 [Chlamydiales bacterium]|nr:hypothetical protein [Chlamydiales bacterium]